MQDLRLSSKHESKNQYGLIVVSEQMFNTVVSSEMPMIPVSYWEYAGDDEVFSAMKMTFFFFLRQSLTESRLVDLPASAT